jgi:AcrR family transcriptional regulator
MTVRARATSLERILADGPTPPSVTALDALRAARRMWLRAGTLDMGKLVAELGISRATLYRWVGDRDRLLSEVLWSLALDTLTGARRAATAEGPDFVAQVLDGFMCDITYHPAMRHFLERDPDYALRILTAQESVIRIRMTAAVHELLTQQVEAATLVPPLDLDTLSYLFVRIMESFMYSDLLAGAEPETHKATVAFRILLHAAPAPPSPF